MTKTWFGLLIFFLSTPIPVSAQVYAPSYQEAEADGYGGYWRPRPLPPIKDMIGHSGRGAGAGGIPRPREK